MLYCRFDLNVSYEDALIFKDIKTWEQMFVMNWK